MTLRIVTGSDAVISSPTFVAADGVTPTDAASLPTVTATRDDGTVVPVGAVTSLGRAGLYSATIVAADLADPDLLTLTWTGTVDGVEQTLTQELDVCGGVFVALFDLWNLRDMPTSKMSPADVVDLREEFEDIAERYNGHAWVARFARDTIEVHCWSVYWRTGSILLSHARPQRLLSAVTADDDTVVDTTAWQLTSSGTIDFASLSATTTLRYVHGADRPPARLVQACKDFVRSKALERFGGNRIGRDVLSVSDGSGASTRYSTADWAAGRPTGLLDVDSALNAYGAPFPGIA
jgi:hypothetical protein